MPEVPLPNNRLLAALPKNQFRKLFPKFERVALVYGKNIYEPCDVIRHVYFPESGIISLLAAVEENYTLEVGIVGDEGIAGIPVFLGVRVSPNSFHMPIRVSIRLLRCLVRCLVRCLR